MTIKRPITKSNPDITVVIPTIPKNDHSAVVECLRRQEFNAFEVVVVNDAQLDICEARNVGIEEADATVVALTDDDCEPPPDWLSEIYEAFEKTPELVCLEGSVIGGLNYHGSRHYVGCNLSFDREEALKVGGFRSEYAGWRDDTEFGWRMERDADGVSIYRESVQMRHPPRPRASIDDEKEQRLKAEYLERYEEVLVPNTVLGKINDWLWRKGVWNLKDNILSK